MNDKHYLKQELYELIKKDETIFDFIQESSLDGMWYWDLENLEEEWMNPKFWRVLGYDPDEMPHKSSAWQHIINQDDLKAATENFTKHCENPNHPYDQLVRYAHKNGSTVWIRCRGMAIRDEQGKAVRMLGAHIDITELKRAQEELNVRYAIFEESEKITKTGSWELDVQTGQTIWSDEVYAIHEVQKGFDHNKANGIEFYHPDYRETIANAISRTISEQTPFDEELLFIAANKTQKWVRSLGKPIIENAKVTKIIGVISDITEKKKYEQSLQAAKAEAQKHSKHKSEFLANMSHEIRTPLNAILGFVDILKERITEPESKKYLETIDSSSQHLLGVIKDILDFSKLESGKLEIEEIDFDVHKEFSTLYELFSARVSEKNLDLVMNIDASLPRALVADPLRLKQVISNLLSNAIKFTPSHKKIYLAISHNNDMLHVSVKDEGIGIAKEKQQKIFEAFSQADSSTTREYGGTGLGLAISNELVCLMGGELKLKSELGEGSEFCFSIPAPVGKLEISQTTQKTYASFEGKKVLLVEDNKANQMFMQVVLKKLDIAFDIANDGLEAVEMFGKSDYDLILMDENMPNMNGMEATKEILTIEQERDQKHTPIIALTANAIKGDREKFLEAGMDEYLTKPVDRQKLQDAMRRFFGDANE